MKSSHAIILLLSMVKSSLGLDVSLTTGFASTNQATGNIFTIKAKDHALSITSFDINMAGPPSPNPAPVEVWFMPGIDDGSMYNPQVEGPYQKIFEMDIMGQGKDNITPLPDFANPVVIPAGATYSFYVTVADLWLGTYVFYNIGTGVGNVYASDQYMEIGEGYSMGYPFLGYSAPRKWNGNIYYSVDAVPPPTPPSPPQSTTPPTNAPTPEPTTSSPTSHPTKSPVLNDTLDPTESPTESPTKSPVRSPTQSPIHGSSTESPVATTSSPTKSPVSPSTPTDGSNNGTGSETQPPSPSPTKKPTTSSPTKSSATLLPTLLPTSSPSKAFEELSGGPTQMLELFLPNRPVAPPSSSVKSSVYFGQFCTVLALLIAAANYVSL